MKITPVYQSSPQIPVLKESAGVPYLSFPALEALGMVRNGFSTRLGGVSRGDFASMNFSASRGDSPEAVLENFTRMARALGVDRDRMTVSWQTHTTNVRRITEEDAGKGVIRPRDYRDVDGLITDVPGITLVTLYADCVPLYFVDPVRRAVGLSHSGWRGTVRRMGAVTIRRMEEEFGSRPEDLVACIGPSICAGCFEVGDEVAAAFKEEFGPAAPKALCPVNPRTGKHHVDLWLANRLVLKEAGVLEKNIHVTGLCTRHNPELLFSHRAAGEKRGNLAAFLGLSGEDR